MDSPTVHTISPVTQMGEPTMMAAFFYIVAFPQRILELGEQLDAGVSWLVTPGIIAVSISAIPIAVALILFWQICTEIGRDNSFCHKNASRLTGIGFCALVDTIDIQ